MTMCGQRARLYVESDAHRTGDDLELIVGWAAGARTALDVATGGGHVARRLREAGLTVVTCDPAPGMHPDVVCRAEELPFADSKFDVVACRTAAHHFSDVGSAVREMARVGRDQVLLVDTVYMGDAAEDAERLRDPSHVRNYTEAEWLRVRRARPASSSTRSSRRAHDRLPAMARAHGLHGGDAERVRELWGRVSTTAGSLSTDRDPRAEGALMAILVDTTTRLVVQGLTGSEGRFHGLRNRSHGTNVVAGVTPGQGRPGRRGHPGLRHGRLGGRGDRREHGDGLRPGAVRGRRDVRGDRLRASRPSSASRRASPRTRCCASTRSSRVAASR